MIDMATNLIQQALDILKKALDDKFAGNMSTAMSAWGMNPKTGLLGKWFRGERIPSMSSLAPILESLGVSLNFDHIETPAHPATKDVCFVDARVVPAGENIEPPQAEDYLAAPLVGEVGAGRGIIAQDDVISWFLVYRHALPAAHSRDLFAVEIAKGSTSMQPTLYPGDIVLVDKGASIDGYYGRMMLVRDPDDGSGMIKRVELKPLKDDTLVTFYSDNAAEWPPMIYSLKEDFDGDLSRAIVGRVIWAWSDVRNK
jgi:phage repressor protein C with HTH and peptisase S24 domain